MMDVCERHGVRIVPFSPLSQGLLAGKYRQGQAIPEVHVQPIKTKYKRC